MTKGQAKIKIAESWKNLDKELDENKTGRSTFPDDKQYLQFKKLTQALKILQITQEINDN